MGAFLRTTLLSATRTHYMSSDVGLRSWAEGKPSSRHTMDDGDDDDDDDDDGDDDDDDDDDDDGDDDHHHHHHHHHHDDLSVRDILNKSAEIKDGLSNGKWLGDVSPRGDYRGSGLGGSKENRGSDLGGSKENIENRKIKR